ncbi:COX15/CtaA family protein [Aquincola sp. S2]|uniref:COX15/CtaA family protein n=1 Tax=Pseudaquabacterium terrae TaxID=2732868 RepID=A0ABX2EDU6_9BURK|nr:COX15/CtaA family protein [Aquabacterium terrae]NRF66774.1 COX15/CtaA family protein [Aquabacterium terrae]
MGTASRLAALTALTLFLTFDLIVFGAFTRLTDSGLGCPDWPGCYGQASPLGARAAIADAQAAMPTGPVTWTKAWIEMIHRYLAMGVGLLIVIAAVGGWWKRATLPHSPWWPTLTLAWVIVQGLFGKYTVTLKLYPAIVTLHLMGGLVLLLLLVLQHESFRDRPLAGRLPRSAIGATLAIVLLQAALGGWVSSNYAVLACRGFPECNGDWWPRMDLAHGFTLLRELGRAGHGGFLPFDALVAIHMAHRLGALLATAALLGLIVGLLRDGGVPTRRFAIVLGGLLALQLASGLSNVVLDWPILAALGHSAGAAALVGTLGALWARWSPLPRGATAPSAGWRAA